MTIREALKKGTDMLEYVEIETPVLEAGVILSFVLGCDRAYIYSHGDKFIGENETNKFFALIEERSRGKPTQYITGFQEFMSLRFEVNQHVLIPRPETEILVEKIIEYVKENYTGRVNILDIGTGSGCISVSLAYYLPDSHITAVDISWEALEVAKRNAENAGVENRVKFIQSDLFSQLPLLQGNMKYDIIVSNPPYIPSLDLTSLQLEVRGYEPLKALDGGDDGLYFYRRIIKGSLDFLKPGGLLAFEVGYNQAQLVCDLMKECFSEVEIIKDLAKVDRVVTGKLKCM
ncbi:MAG TPA: peptide chain release factor N(5)-glutamine methyltransferase [Clostridiaceae bacterium]|nr:peptide chain release factor N(5)-glutamine methyltransferase [Clostridiaceae bacterium]